MVLWTAAWAGGFELPAQGAVAGGMAHVGTALGGRADAAWFNPAGLADGGGFRLAAGAAVAVSRVTAVDLGGAWEATTNAPPAVPPSLSVSYGRAWWAAALHVGTPFAGGVRWPEGWAGRFDSLASAPRFVRTTASLAGTVGPVSLSAGVHVDAGSLRTERATDHITEEGRVTLALRGVGVGGDASVLVRAKSASFGLSYKSRTALPMQGEVDFDLPPAFAADRPDQGVTSRWTLPDRLSVGAAWTRPRWLVALDVGVVLWSVNDTLPLDFEVSDDAEQVNGWRDTVALRLGTEVEVHERVRLRAGLSADGLGGAPPPPERLGPSSPDATRLSGAAGFSVVAHEAVSIDGWVEGIGLLRREAASAELLQASYGGWAVLAGLGVTVQVGGRRGAAEGLERAPEGPVEAAEPGPWGRAPVGPAEGPVEPAVPPEPAAGEEAAPVTPAAPPEPAGGDEAPATPWGEAEEPAPEEAPPAGESPWGPR
jgi:long-chain fatty acid transport protein